jgi:hypothetical protein
LKKKIQSKTQEMKRDRGEERVRIEIEYVDREDYAKITYNKNERLLLIVNLAYTKINTSALPKDVPGREFLEAVLQAVPPKYDSTTGFKASYPIDGSGVATFINIKKWEVFWIDEKGYLVEDVPDSIFVNVLLPMLTYKDVQALEGFSEARKLIFDFDIWKKLFARDFPEIYHPDMFSDALVNQDPPPWYIQLLNNMSKADGRPGIKSGNRPYWKLLYEYQLRNKFEAQRQTVPPNTTFYKHKSLTINIPLQKLIFGSFSRSSFDGTTLSNTPVSKIIKDAGGRIIFLEMNDTYIFVFVFVSRANQIVLLSDMNGDVIFQYHNNRAGENLLDIMGLIGENGYFYQTQDRSETVIGYNQFKNTYKDVESVHVCYNTRSECFLMQVEELGQLVYRLFEIRNNRPVYLRTANNSFTSEDHYITFNHKWTVSCYSLDLNDEITDSFINFETPDGEMNYIEIEGNVNDLCIVADYLYVFGGGHIKVYNLVKIANDQNHDFKQYPSYRDTDYAFVRMSMLGPVFVGYYGQGRDQLLVSSLFYSHSGSLKLVSGVCTQCGKDDSRYLCGNRCGAQYCDTRCQTRDWKNNHSLICARGDGGRRQRKIRKVMTEFKEGRLKTSAGKTVTDRQQALAIALSEANELK